MLLYWKSEKFMIFCNYRIFLNISRGYDFPSKICPKLKIHTQVEQGKTEIWPSIKKKKKTTHFWRIEKKRNLASKHIAKRVKIFPICLSFRWHHSEFRMNQRRANATSSSINLMSFPRRAEELNFFSKWHLLI